MRTLKILTPLLAAGLISACANMPGFGKSDAGTSAAAGNTANFQCENGNKVVIDYRNVDQIVISYQQGNDTVSVKANNAPAASGEFYENDAKTVSWHEKKGMAIFSYPAADYQSSAKIVETVCNRL